MKNLLYCFVLWCILLGPIFFIISLRLTSLWTKRSKRPPMERAVIYFTTGLVFMVMAGPLVWVTLPFFKEKH